MPKLTSFLVFVATSALAASSLQTLAMRSTHHELQIQRAPSGDHIVYDLALTDLDTGASLLRKRVDGNAGGDADVSETLGTKQVRVTLHDRHGVFTAEVDVVDGKKLVDGFITTWQLEPRDLADATDGLPPLIKAPGALRVGGDVKPPSAIRRVEPLYPESARRNHVQGTVTLQLLVGKDGKVKDFAVRKGLPEGLTESAINAVRQWTFAPATLSGEPVEVLFDLTISFRL
jgi:TonB family protein